MGFTLTPAALAAAKAHALSAFPNESCGLVIDGAYKPCTNVAAEPKANFTIAGAELLAAKQSGTLEAVVHSHPTANAAPSSNDMAAQISSKLPFVIVPTNGQTCGTPAIWGDGVDIAPLVGRVFMHGIADCYSAVRDLFRLGKTAAAAQGFDRWPFDPILLAEFPRDDGWWGEPGKPGLDLYTKNFASQGFAKITREEARPGDAFLCKVRSDQFNHAGLLVSSDLIFHHLPGRLSRREPAGLWARSADLWVRLHPACANACQRGSHERHGGIPCVRFTCTGRSGKSTAASSSSRWRPPARRSARCTSTSPASPRTCPRDITSSCAATPRMSGPCGSTCRTSTTSTWAKPTSTSCR